MAGCNKDSVARLANERDIASDALASDGLAETEYVTDACESLFLSTHDLRQ